MAIVRIGGAFSLGFNAESIRRWLSENPDDPGVHLPRESMMVMADEIDELRAALETAERRLRQVDEYSDGLRNRPSDSVPRGLDICSERKHRRGVDDGC